MIAGDPVRLARDAASGLSGTTTLDRLLARQAAAHPDTLALADDPERAAWNDLPPERLSWKALDARVDALAGFLQMIGLAPDAVVALHAPPTVDTVVTLLAVFRAGLIAAPLPLAWSAQKTAAQLVRLRPSALVSHRRVEGLTPADTARTAAADVPGLRFVFGFGPGLSDGVLDLGTMLRFGGGAVPARVARAGNPADHAATLTFGPDDAAGRPALHRRSANHWIATASGPMLEARIGPGTTLLSPYALSGVAGIGAALVPFLLSGGTLHLHQCRDAAGLAAHIGAVAPDIVLAPAPVLPALAARVATPPRAWLALHRDGGGAARPFGETAARLVDVSAPAEATLLARRRTGMRAAALPVGPIAGTLVLAPHIDVEAKALAAIAVARQAYVEGDLRARLRKYHADPDSAFWGWNDVWLSPAFAGWRIHDELAAIRTPLLAIQGERDDYGTMEQIRGIRRRVRHAQLLELPDCGHSPHVDQPERLLAAAVDFIQKHTQDGD